jgi:hypothetical protein
MPDAELTEVLKKRSQYQEIAADCAIREALKRGLILSEAELNHPGFRQVPARFTFFPSPYRAETRQRLLRSLCRSLMIAGVIPAFYGILKMTNLKYAEGTALVSIGIVWIGMSWFLMERNDRRWVFPMFFLILVSIPYVARMMVWYASLKWTDFFIPSVLYVLIIYSLLYVHALLKKQQAGVRRE